MGNYRRIDLLNIIYMIWKAIMENSLKPIMNILNNETQRRYKIKIDSRYNVSKKETLFKKKINGGRSLIGLSKAPRKTGRWGYGKYYMV